MPPSPSVRSETAFRRRSVALIAALASHGLFAGAVFTMVLALYGGLRSGWGPFHGVAAAAADCALLLQFPILHSFALAGPGRRLLSHFAPARYARDLSTTLFTGFASLQLLVVFALWSPIGGPVFEATGALRIVEIVAFVAGWALLVKALADSGLGVQLGFAGWSAVWRGDRPRYGPMPERGLYRASRQPQYLAFAILLWLGPVMTLDRLLLAVPWTVYCVVGPVLKERRYAAMYKERFAAYRERVPYFLPRIGRRPAPPHHPGLSNRLWS